MNGTDIVVDFTCVAYVENTHPWLLSLLLFSNATFPVLLFAAACYALFWKDIHTLYVLCAALFTAMWAVTVKELTRIDRLRPYCTAIAYGGHAMPSLTGSVLAFLATYYIVQFWLHARDLWSRTLLIIRTIFILSYSGIVMYARLYLRYSRPEELLVAACLGGASAVAFILLLKKRRLASYKSSLKSE